MIWKHRFPAIFKPGKETSSQCWSLDATFGLSRLLGCLVTWLLGKAYFGTFWSPGYLVTWLLVTCSPGFLISWLGLLAYLVYLLTSLSGHWLPAYLSVCYLAT